ncbi:hypothetical protein Bhyg_03076, partial [Pseudolycoriella hygida]
KTEVINLAIIPAFDSDLQLIQRQELEQQQHANHHRKHHRHKHRHMQDLTVIHCAMQAMVAIAAMATIFDSSDRIYFISSNIGSVKE